jgi:hypothetical protein
MPDWQELVRQRLRGMALEGGEAEQVIDEIAAHLEDAYRAQLGLGLPDQVALRKALQEVNDWHCLKSEIESVRKEESNVNNRVTQFWLPSLITLFLANVLLAVIQVFGPPHRISNTPGGLIGWTPITMVYVSWIICLLFVGAIGACISRRAGGSWRTVVMSVLFPVLPYLAFFLIGLPLAMLLDDHVARNLTIPAFMIGLIAWVVLPGAALLSGGLPTQHVAFRRRS